jgi:YgiT-type zinc finger domain-containing protein
MKCSIKDCPGEYETRSIVHTVKREDEVLVIENVPASVCGVCSDILLTPETVRHIEEFMRDKPKPHKFAPLYEYI